MVPNAWKDVHRILTIRLDNIGDVVMIGPALRTLRQCLPAAQITLLTSRAGGQVAPLLPWLDEVLVHRAVWQDASGTMPLDPAREHGLIQMIQAHRFDAVVIFTSFAQSPFPPAYVCYLAGIPIRLGQSKEFGGSVLSPWVKPLPDETHQVDRNLFLLESVGFEIAGRALELDVPRGMQAGADNLLWDAGIDPAAPFILLAPGASCPARMYDPARYAVAIRRLTAEGGLPAVVVGSERERELLDLILDARHAPPLTSLVGRTSLPELAGMIRRASLVIANDSGPMHLADAFRRPMVILFSGTELEGQWRPRSAPARLLRRPTKCSPCYRFECPYEMRCLDIEPKEIVAVGLSLLQDAASMAARPTGSE